VLGDVALLLFDLVEPRLGLAGPLLGCRDLGQDCFGRRIGVAELLRELVDALLERGDPVGFRAVGILGLQLIGPAELIPRCNDAGAYFMAGFVRVDRSSYRDRGVLAPLPSFRNRAARRGDWPPAPPCWPPGSWNEFIGLQPKSPGIAGIDPRVAAVVCLMC
jgi:hypothetical protein